MRFFLEGLQGAWQLILGQDPGLLQLLKVTLQVALVSTAAALVLGLPIGLLLGLGRFRGRGFLMVLANAGLGLPPVVVGLVLSLLMFPMAPLGRFHLLYTLRGVLIAQTLLALPIIVALTAAAVQDVAGGLLDQARALGARRHQVAALAVREARVPIMAAVIAAVGSGLSEVGAVILVGGSFTGLDETLASAALQRVQAAQYAEGVAIAIVLLGLILVLTALLTLIQGGGERREARPRLRAMRRIGGAS